MARHQFLLSLLTVQMLVHGVWAQAVVSGTPDPSPLPPASLTPSGSDGADRERGKNRSKPWGMSDRFEKMTPDQRKDAVQKVRRWLDMPNDERAHRRFVQDEREKRTREAVAAAIQASGLQLDSVQKEKFASIYRIERRKLEENLRQEMEQKRKEQLPMLEKTVTDLYRADIATATAVPTVSPTP